MSGIVFFKTPKLDETKTFHIDMIKFFRKFYRENH